ncbi:MAG: homocysteine S-methyltransferase family protein [Desulfobacteraceae bacterium]|jgi:S-methylmethionine-dependent homocysteine/selenocysteine methylase
MSNHRNNLPQMSDTPFITDGGLETTLIFHHGFELPKFAAFDLLTKTNGYEVLRRYYTDYIDLAKSHHVGFILESPTWRASRDWGDKLGHNDADLKEINRKSIALLEELRSESESESTPMVISGCIGPRGDGYSVSEAMTAGQAYRYHYEQIKTLSETKADLVSAFTINYTTELDDGNPHELGARYAELASLLPNLNIFGGCGGTDHRHVEAICAAIVSNN